jgi:hypothetical protein
MENISENTPRKHGRPRKASAITWQVVDQQEGRHTSYRHRANYIYGMRAIEVLGTDPQFAWLHGEQVSTIVDELGRIDDTDDLRLMARHLCTHQPSTREAVALIRRFRFEAFPPGTIAGLVDTLARSLETYVRTHETMPWTAVRQALAEFVDRYQEPLQFPRPTFPRPQTPLQRAVKALADLRTRTS